MRLFLAVLLLTFSALAQAEEPEKERKEPKAGERMKAAWEWSLDERIAKRLDAQQIRERAGARERDLSKDPMRLQAHDSGPVEFVIEGRRNPELFMTFELFGSIFLGIDPRTAKETRDQYRTKIAAFGGRKNSSGRFSRMPAPIFFGSRPKVSPFRPRCGLFLRRSAGSSRPRPRHSTTRNVALVLKQSGRSERNLAGKDSASFSTARSRPKSAFSESCP